MQWRSVSPVIGCACAHHRISGGSFGAKHAVFPYVVLLALAARKAGRPVWVESRLEHLTAATSATNRVTTLSAAVDRDGVVTALAWDQLEDCGAYLRAPEPATLYRMQANMTGAYRVRHLSIRNRVVLTSKTPSGLVRGFGGPQVYFALERLMQRIAVTLRLDPLGVIRRNLVEAFPHRCPAGAILDSGDYRAAVDIATERGGLPQLRDRRDRARSEGRLYGIGFAAVVEPAISNMGYVTTVLGPEERDRAGPKSGAQAAATVSLDPLGSVSVWIDSVPQGQGHRTATAQIVADLFGLTPEAIHVEAAIDTPAAKPRRSRANLRPPSRSACVIDRLRKNQNPLEKSY
jgi:2-furoyl-CoA dehydrogenase large subunit